MNISTGGPHILLFERDQQLTALIISEFQLAGYECHTARTAVEVFDALARYPVRIVLVDLAQAAAARREFWVALDTQRRGRGIHVLTFRCNNIAGYGPTDPEERSQNTVADLDIDGMLGLMKLVDEVRVRVPITGSLTNTIPRLSRIAPTPQPTQGGPTQRTGTFTPITSNNGPTTSGNSFRNIANEENGGNTTAPLRNISGTYTQPGMNTQANTKTGPETTSPFISNKSDTNEMSNTGSQKAVSYTDKIRAVLYPNQRTWNMQENTPVQIPQEQQPIRTIPEGSQTSYLNNPATNNATVLQRLANGQIGMEGQTESGLAQLSRLAQSNYTLTSTETYETNRNSYQPPSDMPMTPEVRFMQSTTATEQAPVNTNPVDHAPPVASPDQTKENISSRPLRASPIQDIPVDRPGNQTGTENSRRPDVLSRTNYGQQPAPTSLPPLASIAASPPPPQIVQASGTVSIPSTPPITSAVQKTPTTLPAEHSEPDEEKPEGQTQTVEESDHNDFEDIDVLFAEMTETKQQKRLDPVQVDEDADAPQNRNSMLFDIMQSLPPMPPIGSQSQTLQAQVLNGRASRSLGSVLLAGHLVPQNRLEVAQNIQRMLCGVDLNYQLGEILLMFKLLTPDQLLAASLVSYGMITTIQVSALGRIRQELHSIGLEYDLESLLILFRILTPEQLREAKSGMQG